MCLSDPKNASFQDVRDAFERLIEFSGLTGSFLAPEDELTQSGVEKVIRTIIDAHYKEYIGKLQFGDEMACQVVTHCITSNFRRIC